MEVLETVGRLRPGWADRAFLSGLDEKACLDLCALGAPVTYPPRAVVVSEGELSTDVLLLLSACMKVTARLDGGGEALMAVRVSGDVVGELAATDGGPRSATVRVCGRDAAVCVRVPAVAFTAFLERTPGAGTLLAASIGRKLRAATRRRADFAGCPPRVRLARALVELADDYGTPLPGNGVMIGVNLTQVELGTLVGVSEVTAQRALTGLRRDGLIDTDGRRPVVRGIEALRAVAQPP